MSHSSVHVAQQHVIFNYYVTQSSSHAQTCTGACIISLSEYAITSKYI